MYITVYIALLIECVSLERAHIGFATGGLIARPCPPLHVSSGNRTSSNLLSLCHPIFISSTFHVYRPDIAEIVLLGRLETTINQSSIVATPYEI